MEKKNFNGLSELLGKLTTPQKALIAGVSITAVILLIILFQILNAPNFTTLYTNLAPADANKVVSELSSKKIPYKLEAGGTTIKVPAKNVYALRLNFAAKGIPNSGIVGYEIFDKNTIGMSEFMQKLNYRRALEGELARTIMQVDGIEAARVHIVFPKEAVFKEDEVKPTASVVIKERSGMPLSQENIIAIQNLIAGSIEKLKPEDVTILDTHGNLLSKKKEENSLAFESSTEYELKKNVEKYLRQKAQEILDDVLGPGNAIVQVNADLNFTQVEKTIQSVDPESQVVISEQTVKNQNIGKNKADSTANYNQNSTVNYEVSKTLQKVIEGTGNITKLTVAAVINQKKIVMKVNGKTKIKYQPRSQEEIQKLEGIIKNAVGFNADRGDAFTIENIAFEPRMNQELELPVDKPTKFFDYKNIDKLINLIIILFAIIASFFVLKGLLKKVKDENALLGAVTTPVSGELAAANGAPVNELARLSQDEDIPQLTKAKKKRILPQGDIEDEITDEAALKKYQHERIANYVQQNPMDAAKLINTWLHEDEFNEQ